MVLLWWFQGPGGQPFRFQCGAHGLHIPRLAAELQLQPSPLKVNGVVVDHDPDTGYLSRDDAQAICQGLGDTPETAIPVTGQPAGVHQLRVATACLYWA
jgi:hypothetical protein